MEYDLSIDIRRPPTEVFALLADVQEHALGRGSPVTAMEKLPPGPTRIGTRWHEVIRVAPGLRMTVWSEATAVDPPRQLSERFVGPGMQGELTYLLESIPGGTRLHQRESIRPVGLARLVAPLIDRMLRPRLVQRLDEIRRLLETR
jgi:hypothetical protein